MKKGGFPDFEAWKLQMTYSSDMICLRFLVYPRSQVFHAGVFLIVLRCLTRRCSRLVGSLVGRVVDRMASSHAAVFIVA